jgi:hypothetical protein
VTRQIIFEDGVFTLRWKALKGEEKILAMENCTLFTRQCRKHGRVTAISSKDRTLRSVLDAWLAICCERLRNDIGVVFDGG